MVSNAPPPFCRLGGMIIIIILLTEQLRHDAESQSLRFADPTYHAEAATEAQLGQPRL